MSTLDNRGFTDYKDYVTLTILNGQDASDSFQLWANDILALRIPYFTPNTISLLIIEYSLDNINFYKSYNASTGARLEVLCNHDGDQDYSFIAIKSEDLRKGLYIRFKTVAPVTSNVTIDVIYEQGK